MLPLFVPQAKNNCHTIRKKIKIILHNLESSSYSTNDYSKLEDLLNNLEKLNTSFRSSLPSQHGLCVLPTRCKLLRAKKIKRKALKRLQMSSKYASLTSTKKGHPGRKKMHWRIRNRVGAKVCQLKKVSYLMHDSVKPEILVCH